MKKFTEVFGYKLASEIFQKFLDAYALNHGSNNKPDSVVYWFEDILDEVCPNPEALDSKLFKDFESWNTTPWWDKDGVKGVGISYNYANEDWPGEYEPATWSTRPWLISFEEMSQFIEEKR